MTSWMRGSSLAAFLLLLSSCGGGSAVEASDRANGSAGNGSQVFPSGTGASSSASASASGASKCSPERIATPDWVPRDLPLPKGSYPYKDLGKRRGTYSGVFWVPGTTREFARYVLAAWPKAGYRLGKGDAEETEVEDEFRKGSASGAFRARDQDCRPPHMEVLLLYWAHSTETR